jgi:hypothetical protein
MPVKCIIIIILHIIVQNKIHKNKIRSTAQNLVFFLLTTLTIIFSNFNNKRRMGIKVVIVIKLNKFLNDEI